MWNIMFVDLILKSIKQKERCLQMTILCEQCGNDFSYGKRVEIQGEARIICPYCKWRNKLPYSNHGGRKFTSSFPNKRDRKQNN